MHNSAIESKMKDFLEKEIKLYELTLSIDDLMSELKIITEHEAHEKDSSKHTVFQADSKKK